MKESNITAELVQAYFVRGRCQLQNPAGKSLF